jgi:hypothetical protein
MADPRRALILGCVLLAAVIASGIAAASTRWHSLQSVRVTVSNQSLPPPFGKARTTTFTPGHGLKRAQNALNANDIRRLAKPKTFAIACTGGYNATIEIVRHDGTAVKMSGYRCGGATSGRIGGNLPGFLKAVGISPP